MTRMYFFRFTSYLYFIILSLNWWGCKPGSPVSHAPNLELIWRHEGNTTKDGSTTHGQTLWLVNHGTEPLGDKGWALYWNQMPNFVTASTGKLEVKNINGDYYTMKPVEGFSLAPGDTATTTYTSQGFAIKTTDRPLGIYVAWQTGGEEKTAPITQYTALPFKDPAQFTRNNDDVEPYPHAAFLYQQNQRMRVLQPNETYPFVPAPLKWTWGQGSFALPANCRIAAAPELEAEAKYLAEELKRQFNLNASVDKASGAKGDIVLGIAASTKNKEGYTMGVDVRSGVSIQGGSPAGAFYGIQSLLSMVKTDAKNAATVPAISITDEPFFGYRGLQMDVSRNFQSKETILRMLDMLARYKLNRLLLYVTEDEGWRVEIKSLPELTEVGSRRGHLHRDSLCLQPGYGSGPDPDDPDSNGNGYYTRKDFIEIIQYAHQRHIQVIPEVNLPGHARAAIRAMELRYNRLMKEGKTEEAKKYRLRDPDDTSKYISAQGYFDNTVCVCQDQVYRFFETALDDIIGMYKEANVPLELFHTGGDEVPDKAWTGSPICKEYLKQHPEIKNIRNLHGHFFGKMADIVRSRGLKTGAWEEVVLKFDDNGDGVKPNPEFVGKEVYPYIWNNIWGNEDLGYRLANMGYPVILCNVTNFYFDLAYNKDPREPGLYWAGFVDTEDAFSFVPHNVFESTVVNNMGKPYTPADFTNKERLTPTGKANLYGVQAQLWSETIKGRDMLEYYYLPKLLGFAHRAWQGEPVWAGRGESARNEDWNRFMNTVVQNEIPHLDKAGGGYHYRIPSPGIAIEGGQLKMNSTYPGFTIRYTTDGTEPTKDSPIYEGPIPDEGKPIKAACFNSKGRSGFSTEGPVKN